MTQPRTAARSPGSAAVIDPRVVPRSGIDSFWELATDLFAICGRDGMLYALNPAWERLLGWSREDLTTRSLLAFVHPDDAEATVEVLARTSPAASSTSSSTAGAAATAATARSRGAERPTATCGAWSGAT